MHIFVSFLLVLLALPSADPPPATIPAPGAADPAVIQWLDKLEARGKEIKSFQATVKYEKADELLSDEQVRTGKVTFLSTDGKPTRFAVLFKDLLVDDKVIAQQLEFIFDGQSLVEKDHKAKRFVKRQVVAPGQESDVEPLSIDGPFPLPIGQKRDRVLRRFDVAIVQDKDPDSPPNSVHLHLLPRADVPPQPGQKQFDRVDLWFDKTTLLPIKVQTKDGSAITTVELSNVKVNEADPAKIAELFDIEPPKAGWQVELKPWKD